MADWPNYLAVDLEPVIPEHAIDRFPDELYTALLIRRTEERLLELFSEGKLFGTVHTCIGQEFVGVAIARALLPHDNIFSNHRGHGHFLARTGNVLGLIGEVMGKSVGICAGRGGSQHLQQDHYYSNGVQGGIAPVSAGLAFAQRLQKSSGISVVFIGDGTLGEGVLYESMNIASKHDLPLLFVCENNLFAQSTSQVQTLAGDICMRAQAFGIDTAHDNTWNWPALLNSIRLSVQRVRETSRPVFHRVDTFRLMAHSKGDDNRPFAYVDIHRKRDPLHVMMNRFKGDPRWRSMLEHIDGAIAKAVAQAEAAPFDKLSLPTAPAPAQTAWHTLTFPRERIVHAVRRGLGEALRDHPQLVLLGEDIESPYGGAFKCTQGLSDDFPGRVNNMPISEAAMVGVGNGLALAGMKPVVEIMFGDFLTLAADQWLNHAAKFRFMYNDKVTVPVVVRTPMGGKRGYAATHSQSIEKHFLGVPDTLVLCLHHRYSPALLYKTLLATVDRPTLVIENKILYGQTCSSDAPAGFRLRFESNASFPMAHLEPDLDPQLTIIAVGGVGVDAEQAAIRLFQDEEVAADLFLPSCLYPFDISPLAESLKKTRRLLVVEEGQGFASLSSEILAQVAERFAAYNIVCRRLNAAPIPIPAARPLEQLCLPGVDHILLQAKALLRESTH